MVGGGHEIDKCINELCHIAIVLWSTVQLSMQFYKNSSFRRVCVSAKKHQVHAQACHATNGLIWLDTKTKETKRSSNPYNLRLLHPELSKGGTKGQKGN